MVDRKVIHLAYTVQAAAYADGDVVGSVTELPNAVRNAGGGALLKSLVVTDAADQKAALDVYFFRQAPATTVGADNAAFALADSDLPVLLGRIRVAAADYLTAGGNAEATLKNIDLLLQAYPKTTSVYVLVVSRGAPTYAATTNLKLNFGLEM